MKIETPTENLHAVCQALMRDGYNINAPGLAARFNGRALMSASRLSPKHREPCRGPVRVNVAMADDGVVDVEAHREV